MAKDKFYIPRTEVSETAHKRLKVHCAKNDIRMKKFVADAVAEKLEKEKR